MKKILTVAFLLVFTVSAWLNAQNKVYIYEPQVPVLIERTDNVLMYIRETSKS